MRTYERPVAIANDELVEGVYMASGDSASGSACYTATAHIHQTPETGRGDYRIQCDAKHAATDGHMCENQRLVISFNIPVQYIGSQGTLEGGDGTTTLKIAYKYHNNGYDNIGLGDVIVTADAGLSITNVKMVDVDLEG